ncbi:putative coat protein YlbD-like [Thermolongibacillus altinsuensis]|uniref:Putative coat protein YlbD-like n=1 Tax=Thermolongibacillus altinsuensis TaxID=575256 RepID=A0A4R1QEC9_9BACL|nr:YlbD family protein [Thermolongibacillus altinsuensis]TCL50253.1 putative coat protein YlbD-like [Thermolongibacillus altinsuensis]
MAANNIHPSVEQFKQFIKKHPKLVREVRSGKKTWKELYNDWYLFGEEDEIWNEYKEEIETESSAALMQKLATYLQKIDINHLQQHISTVQQAITSIQNIVRQMQETNSTKSSIHPFSFRKD